MTQQEFEALYRHRHRDYKGRMVDGRRSVLDMDRETGATVLVPEPEPGDYERGFMAGVRGGGYASGNQRFVRGYLAGARWQARS